MAGEEEGCSICLESLTHLAGVEGESSPDAVFKPACGHKIHSHCLHRSIKAGNYSCPVCRSPLSGNGDSGADGPTECEARSKQLKRYTRMLQSKVPAAAVKQRMVVDGISPKIIDDFFTGGTSRQVALAADDDDDDDVPDTAVASTSLEKYRKMLEIGIPEGAVRNKMVVAGCSADDIDSFFQSFYGGLKEDEGGG